MFEWFKSKPKEVPKPYVNPFSDGDRVLLIWRLYNEGSSYMRLTKEDRDAEREDNNAKRGSIFKSNFDMFQIVIDQGKTGTVVWTTKYATTVSFDGLPFDVTVCNDALKKLEDK